MKLYLFVIQSDGDGGSYSVSFVTHAIYAVSRAIALQRLQIEEKDIESEAETSDPSQPLTVESPSNDYL